MTYCNVDTTVRLGEPRGPARMHRRSNSRGISGTGHQEEFVRLLGAHGIIVTRSCISRDPARSGAMKGAGGDGLRPLNLVEEDRRTLSSHAHGRLRREAGLTDSRSGGNA